MLIKFDSTFKEALKIAGETDFEAQGARLVGISAIGGFTYMQIELLASDGVLSGIVTSIEEVKAVADQTGAEMVTAQEALSPGSRLSHTKLDDVSATDHHSNATDHTQNTDSDLDATFEATFEKGANKGVANGYASLGAGNKVTEQPASITDHLEGTPTEGLATKAPTSEWAFDHEAAGGGMPADFANLSDAQKTFIMVYGI